MTIRQRKYIGRACRAVVAAVIILCAGLLPGCGLAEQLLLEAVNSLAQSQPETSARVIPEEALDLESYRRGREPVHFSELTYTRPDLDKMERQMREHIEGIRQSRTLADAFGHMKHARDLLLDYDTMYVLCDIYSDIDLGDEYWIAEWDFCDDGYELYDTLWDDVYDALYDSTYSTQLLSLWNFYDDIPYRSSENSSESDVLFDELDEIVDKAVDIIDNATILYNGEELTRYDTYYLDGWVDACAAWYERYGEELLDLYTRMVKAGSKLAREYYRYDSYAEYLFDGYGRDYTPDMARSLLEDIVTDILPLDDAICEGDYLSELPEGYGDFADCLEMARAVLGEMEPQMVDALELMREYGLYYTDVGDNMYSRAYVNHLANPNVPFMYCPFSDDLSSVGDFTHEFGHFYEIYLTMDNNCMTDDLSEVHSQTMSLLFAQTYKELSGDDALLRYILADTVDTLISQSYNAAIELQVFALEPGEITAERIAEIGLAESDRFGYGQQHELFRQYRWLTDTEIFTAPLQPFSYAASATVALDVWRLALEDRETALGAYNKLILRTQNHKFRFNIAAAGLQSPFEEGWTSNTSDFLHGYLFDENALPEAA